MSWSDYGIERKASQSSLIKDRKIGVALGNEKLLDNLFGIMVRLMKLQSFSILGKKLIPGKEV